MPKLISVSLICDNLATLARSHGIKSLAMWLEYAAKDAYAHDLKTAAHLDERIGIFDWDIGRDVDYTNPVAADFFNLSPEMAAAGRPIGDFLSAIHASDRTEIMTELNRLAKRGGVFKAEYRVVSGDHVRWLRADGICSSERDGRPIRLMGSIVDVSDRHREHNVVEIRPRN